ncbi:MAG: serine--tRNA ligase [Spirochaetales bacterium]|nr:serine--tRNA ligase [Spirochaetales bacterium]
MLDSNLLRDDPDQLETMLARRHYSGFGVEAIRNQVERFKTLKGQMDGLRGRKNALSKNIGQLMAQKKQKDAEALKKEVKEISTELDGLEEEFRQAETDFRTSLLELPNWVAADVPDGADDKGNVEIKKGGQIPRKDFAVQPHYEIGEKLGLFDFERGVKLAGSRFYTYFGMGARLERALINFMLDHAREHGYTEVFVPLLVNDACMEGTGQYPKFAGEFYRLAEDGLNLIPTSEVPLVNLYRDEILPGDQLPIALSAATSCFRREAGAAGKDTRGLVRVHQFQKVELVQICRPEDSQRIHEEMVSCVESLLGRLGLPYRILLLCSGDMGFAAAKTYDFEVWMPGLKRYLEISSVSNCLDFQGRRAMIRYRPAGPASKPVPVHTLNGSGVAAGRAMAAILENYQTADGNFELPECLKPYLA